MSEEKINHAPEDAAAAAEAELNAKLAKPSLMDIFFAVPAKAGISQSIILSLTF